MGFWWVALKDGLIIGRDRKALLTLVFMPILLIGILGAAFGNMMGDKEASIKKFKVGVSNLDEGDLGSILEKDIFINGLPDLLSAKPMNEEEMNKELIKQNISVGLILPSDFSEAIASGEKLNLSIVSIPSATIPAVITENIVHQFAQSAAVSVIGMQLAAKGAAIEEGDNQSLGEAASVLDSFNLIKEVAVKQNQTPVSSFQYYAAGMGVMFLLMTVVTGVGAMIEEKEQEVYSRLLISKLTNGNYLLGKFLGLLFISSIQFLVIILGTSLFYGVNWGDSVTGVFLVGLSFVFGVCGLGVLLGSLAKTEKSFSVAGMLAVQIMAAVGGSMVPLYVFPDWMNEIVKVLPNALALQTFLELMSGGIIAEVVFEAAILIAIGSASLIAAWIALSVQRRGSNA
ncbi:MAG TPA: ABC transporter permease [Bacillus bacterium]|nr:ABC transporter permease [Bacillus sp. (in: firmicutes)]